MNCAPITRRQYGNSRLQKWARATHTAKALEAAADAVSFEFEVSRRALLGRIRVQPVSEARHALLAIAYIIEPRSSVRMLAATLKRDHNSVRFSLRRAMDLAQTDARYGARFDAAKEASRRQLRPSLILVGDGEPRRAEA